MKPIKTLVYTLMILLYTGCSSHRIGGYLLQEPTLEIPPLGKIDLAIGVERIALPQYLKRGFVVYENDRGELVEERDAKWAVHLPDALTDRLIAYLQERLHSPRIYHYPWQTHSEPPLLLRVTIDRFIAHEGRLLLRAQWQLYDTKDRHLKSGIYRTTVPLSPRFKAQEIVEAMNLAFSRLEEEIARSILDHTDKKDMFGTDGGRIKKKF